jgi:acyl carrier protein
MSRATAIELLAEALRVQPGDLPADASLAATEGWDSMAHVRLILALEDRLDRMLEPEEVVGLSSLADIAALLGDGR